MRAKKLLKFIRAGEHQRMGNYSLKCCNKMMQIIKTITLYDTEKHIHRAITVARCKNPKCGCLKAQIVYYDRVKGHFVYRNIKSKDVHKIVSEYEKKPYLSSDAFQKIRQGSRENMNWKYSYKGVVYDLNGTNYGKADKYGK